MARFSLSLKDINKMVLLITIASLAYKRGHFSGTLIPSPFQILFAVSVILTIVYVLRDLSAKEFFRSLPRNISIATASLYAAVLIGWGIGNFLLGIPTTVATFFDFGTFTISIVTFLLVLFYTRDDQRFATWCLYALLIPNVYPFYFFLTHGFIAYWGALNDDSLRGLVDPNLFSKTLLIPALFFICTSLFAARNRRWRMTVVCVIAASLYSTLILWTASRGSILSLVAGALLLWITFSFQQFTWKKLVGGATIILLVFLSAYAIVPQGTKHELYAKILHTGNLPSSVNGNIASILYDPSVTTEDLQKTPRTDVRIFEWSYFLKYGFRHPIGVGPSASSVDYQKGGELQLRPGNTYIQVWLWGGVVAFISFLYLIRGAFNALWISLQKNFNSKSHALLAIIFALSIAIIFDASLYFYWYFIVLALALNTASYES